MFNRLQIAGFVLLAVVLTSGEMYLSHLLGKARKYDATKIELQKERDAHARTIETNRRQIAERDAASRGYQSELSLLRERVRAAPTPVVRLCPQPAPGPASHDAPAAAAGLVPTPAAPGVVSGTTGTNPADPVPGPDIGPDLAALMDRADQLSAQLRAILALETTADGR